MNKQIELNQDDFRYFLRNELNRRCKVNPAYSLRAFAKLLGISHTALSQIMSNKRSITRKTLNQISKVLALSPEQVVKFQFSRETTFEERFKPAQVDDFDIYSDSIHDAILELTHLKVFKPDLKWIAKVLEVNVNQVIAAVERLKRARLLEVKKNGQWIDCTPNNTTDNLNNFTHAAFRKYQKELLEKSINALERYPREERDHTSLMLVFSKEDMQEAKKWIRDFRTRFSVKSKEINHKKNGQEVFVLNISFFPISNSKENL